jgi:hypothetical protein
MDGEHRESAVKKERTERWESDDLGTNLVQFCSAKFTGQAKRRPVAIQDVLDPQHQRRRLGLTGPVQRRGQRKDLEILRSQGALWSQ